MGCLSWFVRSPGPRNLPPGRGRDAAASTRSRRRRDAAARRRSRVATLDAVRDAALGPNATLEMVRRDAVVPWSGPATRDELGH